MRQVRVIAALAMAALIVTACSGAATTPAPATAAPATAAPASAGGGGGNAVTIQNFAFNPAELTTTGAVTWTNLDDQAHTVVFDDTTIKPSDNLTKGGAPFTVTFAGPGTYPYKCGIHPNMKGTVKIS